MTKHANTPTKSLDPAFPSEGAEQDSVHATHLKRLSFCNPKEREAHIQAFLHWLPKDLYPLPGIRWELLPSPVMGYLIRTVADGPDALLITFAIGCAMDAVKNQTLLSYCRQLTRLLRRLRTQYGMSNPIELGSRALWGRFVAERTLTYGEAQMLATYETLASLHIPAYLDGLTERERLIWKQYALPSFPKGFVDKQAQHRAASAASMQKRKEQAEVLLPLFPLLVEIASLRKQAAERFIKEFRKQRDRAVSGEIVLPYRFQFTDRQFEVSERAPSLASVQLKEREVTVSLTLWDRVSWVEAHAQRYSHHTQWAMCNRLDAYMPERALYFLQYHGEPSDFLWYGDLLVAQQFGYERVEKEFKRKALIVSRPGLLTPASSDSIWLAYASRSEREAVLFEPESLYRATLYAAALASLSLTNGSRLTELLQVSASRFETIVVDELKNQQPTGRKMGILVQNLLPKGATQESERQFFLISEMAARLLAEIGQLLQETHGGAIPVVHPYANTKAEDLRPEPYLFQWAASADERLGLLTSADVGPLLRFLFHGLTLTTRAGEPIRVAPHLLRHILATHARHIQKVPAEAVAFLLHHRVMLEGGTRSLTISEATAYYSRMPIHHLLALLFEAQSKLTAHRNCSYLQAPLPQTLEQMDAALRHIFEQWGLIGPTAFGFCSAGVCIRPENRALCLGCQYLVPHYSNLPKAKAWRKLYVLQAQMHDAHGHRVDAHQARQMLHALDDVIRVMEIQIHTRQDGGYLPFADTLKPATDDEGEEA